MIRYLIRRLIQAVFVVWAAYTVTFFVLYLLPSDPIAILLGAGGQNAVVATNPAQVAAVRAQYGFDKPVLEQYFMMLWQAGHGDFGTSISTGVGVRERILAVLPPTAALTGLALLLAAVLGVGVALLASYAQARVVRQLLLSLPSMGIAVPGFWLAVLLIQTVSFQWKLLPATGAAGFASLILPAITMAVPAGAVIAQVLAKSMRQTLKEPYIDVVRARGASRARIHIRHAVRNASLPAMTLIGLLTANLIAGAAVAETIFARPGLGRLTVQAVRDQDIPVVQGVVVFAAVATAIITLIVDVLYPVIDPRTRLSKGAG